MLLASKHSKNRGRPTLSLLPEEQRLMGKACVSAYAWTPLLVAFDCRLELQGFAAPSAMGQP